ncbi:MAG TPA: TonB-dependent receptor [Haliscomenobacter sp.]|uniref:TonB-dependent receptor domain-containing protein n=1 Tax=Haliscomenobacter sp. TaxID=2717303 RepID=UPI002CB944B8|nr:TonB-dependent receptor [Haliscomenobacter sp.]HOY18429.1 TonB-dependent receptor [Haliscomenobacter sp.]
MKKIISTQLLLLSIVALSAQQPLTKPAQDTTKKPGQQWQGQRPAQTGAQPGQAPAAGGPPAAWQAQGPSITGRIAGVLLDSSSRQPVEFATVVLINAQSQKQLDGVVTDDKGIFKFPEVTLGKYDLVVSFIGYRSKTLKGITLTPQKPDYSTGNFFLAAESVNLATVEVVGQQAVMENKIDKFVYNADKDITSSVGDASDVLQRVPLLAVDGDGNLSLRGSSNLQILINGKPSALFSGGNVGDALKSIPADQIKSVEVITNPSAKYDGEGSAGIVNIITKKKSAEGFTGTVSASGGTRSNNANLSLNYQRGRFGLNFNGGSFYTPPRSSSSTFLREDFLSTGTRTLDQVTNGNSSYYGPRGTLGMNYDINAYNSINSSLTFNGFGQISDNTTAALFLDPASNFRQEYTRVAEANSLRGGFDWNSDYRRTFKTPEQELSFSIQLTGQNSLTKNTLSQEGNDPSLLRNEKNDNRGINLETTLQLDYAHPFSKKVKLETGIKGVLRDIDSDFSYSAYNQDNQQYVTDPQRSDVFLYDQNVLAGYASFNIKLGEKWGIIAGTRYERTDIAGKYQNQERVPFASDYDNFLPSIIINRNLKKPGSSVKLSYANRIQRPSLRFVNPYIELTDPRDITVGTPLLFPEQTDQLEFNYNTFLKGGTVINAGIFTRFTNAIIEPFTIVINDTDNIPAEQEALINSIKPFLGQIDDGISITTYQNIGKSTTIGFNFFSSVTIKKVQFRGGATVSHYTGEGILAGERVSNSGIVWNGNLNFTWTMSKSLKFEANGFYLSPRVGIQGVRSAYTRSSFGIRKEIWKKKGSIGIVAVQPFQRDVRFPTRLEGATFRQTSEYAFAQRSYGLSFSYRFGKLDFNKAPRQRNTKIKNDDLKDSGENSGF